MSGTTAVPGLSTGQNIDSARPKPVPILLNDAGFDIDKIKNIFEICNKGILEAHRVLQQYVAKHGATILDRWENSDETKRVQSLKKAMPLMPSTRMPDSAQTMQYSRADYKRVHYSCAINTTDLAHEDYLPYLLFNRAKYRPGEYILADLDQTLFDISNIGVGNNRFPDVVAVFLQGANRYGRICSRNDARTNNWNTWGLRKALFVVETQAWLYGLLVRICKSILPESEFHENLKEEPFQPMPDPKEAAANRWTTAPYLALLTIYKRPSDLNLAAFDILIDAQLSENMSEYAELRVDPLYFCDCMIAVADKNKTTRVLASPVPLPSTDVQATMTVITDAYHGVLYWNWIRRLGRKLLHMESTGSMFVGPQKLSPEGIATFQLLEDTLQGISEYFAMAVLYGVKAVVNSDVNGSQVQSAASTDAGKDLLQLMQDLYDEVKKQQGSKRDDLLVVTLIARVQAVIDNNPEASPYLTANVLRLFAQLVVLAAFMRHLTSCQPLQSQWRTAPRTDASVLPRMILTIRLSKAQEEIVSCCKGCSLDVRDAKLKRPADLTTKKGRKAKSKLDAFWDTMDSHLGHKSLVLSADDEDDGWWKDDRKQRAVLDGIFLQIREDAEWLAGGSRGGQSPTASDQQTKRPDLGTAMAGMRLSPTSTIPHGGRESSLSKLPPSKEKQRQKSRPETHDGEQQPAAPAQDVEELQPPPAAAVIGLYKDSWDVMDFCFNMSETQQPGEISWQGFCQAMDEVGFDAVEGGGSAVNFQPKRGSRWTESIVIHKPHGATTKIPNHHSHGYRRRLARRFGWDQDIFVLRT